MQHPTITPKQSKFLSQLVHFKPQSEFELIDAIILQACEIDLPHISEDPDTHALMEQGISERTFLFLDKDKLLNNLLNGVSIYFSDQQVFDKQAAKLGVKPELIADGYETLQKHIDALLDKKALASAVFVDDKSLAIFKHTVQQRHYHAKVMARQVVCRYVEFCCRYFNI